MIARATTDLSRTMRFGGLWVDWPAGVLQPRRWTIGQSEWAAELATTSGVGEILELCAGAGQIGQEAMRRSGVQLVQVEVDSRACTAAMCNAVNNGLSDRVTVLNRSLESLVAEPLGRRFRLVLADPPYLPTDECDRYPQDPIAAIDGGTEGLDLARLALAVAELHLHTDGLLLLQVAGERQAIDLAEHGAPLQLAEVRVHDPERAVACFVHARSR